MSNFHTNLNKNFEKLVNNSMKDIARDLQRRMDRLSVELKDKPLADAKRRLKREWERDGGSLTDPELTEYAEILIGGGRINFSATPFRMR
jgi:hypothetical protein